MPPLVIKYVLQLHYTIVNNPDRVCFTALQEVRNTETGDGGGCTLSHFMW